MKISLKTLKTLIRETIGSQPPSEIKVGDEFNIHNKKGIATVTVQDISVVYTENGSNEAIISYQYEINGRYGTDSSGAAEFRRLWN